jgi:hypothetical protein
MINNDIFDTEPWLDSDHYQTSRWLDNKRISYGFYTIQIWENDELLHVYSTNYNDVQERTETLFASNDDNVRKFDNEYFTKEHTNDAYNSFDLFYNLKLSNIKCKRLKIDEFIEKTKRIYYRETRSLEIIRR